MYIIILTFFNFTACAFVLQSSRRGQRTLAQMTPTFGPTRLPRRPTASLAQIVASLEARIDCEMDLDMCDCSIIGG